MGLLLKKGYVRKPLGPYSKLFFMQWRGRRSRHPPPLLLVYERTGSKTDGNTYDYFL